MGGRKALPQFNHTRVTKSVVSGGNKLQKKPHFLEFHDRRFALAEKRSMSNVQICCDLANTAAE